MLASVNEAGWLGMSTGEVESLEAAMQAGEPVAKEAGEVSGSAKKPGHVEFAGQGVHAGGVPNKEGPQPAQPVPSADSLNGAGQVIGVQSREESGVGMLGCSPGPH